MFATSTGLATNPTQNINTHTQPRELGVMDRMSGVRSGAWELEAAIRAFMDKLAGSPPAPASTTTAASPPQGVHSILEETEASIRSSYAMLKELYERF